jgi:YVTN family beta-propeller protein
MYPYAIGEDVTFHPTGRAAFMINVTSPPGLIVLNTDRFSGGFGNATTITLSAGPTSLDVSRDGKYVYVYCGDPSPDWSLDVYRVNCEKPDSCFYDSYCHLSINDVEVISGDNTIRIAPQGTFGIRTQLSTGFIEYDVNCPGSEIPWALDSEIGLEYAFTPDGTRIYSAGGSTYGLRMYDFLAAESIAVASGNNQTGVAGELLPAPIRVQVGTTAAGRQLDGIPVTFEALNNGALLTGDGFKAKTIVATDVDGFAEIQWRLGDLGANSVRVTATGLTGQPFNFTATANPDPSTLPLSLAEVIPLNNTPDVSPTTALLATFSRAVDPTTIGAATLYLRDAISTEMVPATYGFTDSNRKVSLTPGATLSLGTAYELVLTAGIQAMGGSPLSNPGSSYFTTIGSVPLRVSSVSPPSALAGVTVVVSGTGFDATPSNNTVLFNSLAVTPVSGGPGSLNVVVPVGAASGTISVVVNAQTSNALPFTVLTPNTSPIDEVIANVGTGTGAKSCAVTPDGALVYTVGTDGDVIIPVDVDGQTALSSIRVGDQPVAIVIHPDGKIAYVANFNSGTVSVINTDPASPDFNKVVQTITVGANPADLAVDAAGNRLLVANAGASTVSVVDANSSSSTYHAVVANVGTGTGAKSVAVSPDGTVYVGTDTGFAVIDQSNSVVANVGTGTGGKSVAVSPDGTLLFILTTDGEILVVDIQEGSPSQNEVVANVGAGNGGKSVAVSPDGTLLYLIPEVGDEVLVFEVSIVAGVSATDPDGAAPNFRVESRLLTTIETGSDPSSVAVDPSGSGAVFITNEGDRTLSIVDRNPVPIEACFHVFPPLLIVKLNNPYVTGWVQLPAGYAVRDIDVNTVRMNGAVAAIPDKVLYRDFSFDHVEDVIFTFHRAELIATLDPTRLLHRVTITGDVGDRTFTGESWLIAIFPRIGKPGSQGNTVTPGRKTTISWLTPAAYSVDFVDVHVSYDNGETWEPIATQVENLGEVSWTPSPPSSGEQKTGIVMVTLYQNGEVLLQGQSAEPFTIAAPQAMTQLKSFDVAVEDGTAVLRWQTLVEAGMDGFQVLRSDAEEGVYAAVAKETIAAAGRSEGASYEYRDESVHANRTYWYKLQEVRSDGSGQEFGPYSLSYQLAYGLEQNVPNPFNPTTTIKYALAADGPVTLTIYDVKGARVRELVNESRRADVYRVVWDGSNENGERVASGVYFYRLVAGTYTQTRKMMLLK